MKRLLACATLALAPVAGAATLELVTENNPPFNFAEGKEVKGAATAAVRDLMAKAGLTARDARFFKIGALKSDAKVDFMRNEGASSIRESDKDSDNAVRLTLPKTDPLAIDLWVTSQATAKEMAAAVGVKDLKEVLVVKKQDLYLACNPRTDKATLEKLAAASKAK